MKPSLLPTREEIHAAYQQGEEVVLDMLSQAFTGTPYAPDFIVATALGSFQPFNG